MRNTVLRTNFNDLPFWFCPVLKIERLIGSAGQDFGETGIQLLHAVRWALVSDRKAGISHYSTSWRCWYEAYMQ